MTPEPTDELISEDEVRLRLAETRPLEQLIALRDSQEGIRYRPTTERGEQTFDAILDAALEVLTEESLRGITTRKVSDRAGVNIATLYQYFRDIEAVLMALSLKFQIAQTTFLVDQSVDLAMGKDFSLWVDDLARSLVDIRLKNPSLTALVYATKALPYLHEVVNLGWESGARLFAMALSIRNPPMTAEEILPYARASNSAVRLTLDDTISREPFDRERFELVCQMAFDFLIKNIRSEAKGS